MDPTRTLPASGGPADPGRPDGTGARSEDPAVASARGGWNARAQAPSTWPHPSPSPTAVAHPPVAAVSRPPAEVAPPTYPPATRWPFALVGGLVSITVVIALASIFVQTSVGQWVEQVALRGSELGRETFSPLTSLVLDIVSVPFLVVATAVCAGVALIRRRWGDAIRVLVIVGGANLTTQVLKDVIERPALLQEWEGVASFPSGHTTVAASLAAVALLVAPRAARPAVALLGAGYMIATGVATLSLAWHRPADVIGAFAVVTSWTLLSMIPTRGTPADGASGTTGRVLAGWFLGLVAGIGVAIGAVAVVVIARDATGVPAQAPQTLQYIAYLTSSLGIVGAACLAQWALLLARR